MSDDLRDRLATALEFPYECGASTAQLIDALLPVVRDAIAEELEAAAEDSETAWKIAGQYRDVRTASSAVGEYREAIRDRAAKIRGER